MKKIFLFLVIIFSPAFVFGQLTGDGTYANPWSGTLAGDATWSGTKYINGDITVDNEKLTISSGAIIIFLAETADLIITSTGQIEANGTALSMIRFTSDDDNDGTYGETGERRGHISFQSMGSAGSSSFDYCLFEYSDVLLYPNNDPRGAGGGLFLNFNSVTVSHCTFQHNKAQWGGGVFVYSDRSPSISRCYFYDNFAKEAGGGIYLWDRSGSVVENCIFYSNNCQGFSSSSYTGGGLTAQSSTSVKVVNCTFTYNTSSRTEGQGIMLYSSANARVINSISWGSSKEVYCAGTTASNIINCAYQGITYSSGTPVSPVVLNPSNTDPAGPNFVATDGSDWSITYISPCRDKGVDSYPGVTIPTLDYAGDVRAKTTDIGAYEVQYSTWKTTAATTDWATAANWDGGVPSSKSYVFIPSGATNYPTGSSSQNYTISTGKFMVLNPGAKATLGTLTNNGTLTLESDATGISSLIVSTFSGNAATIELFLTGGGTKTTYKWHYISTPVSSLPVSTFAPGTTLDVAQWIENRPTLSLREGWVAYDGYIYSTGLMGGPTFSSLTPGKGYDYWDSADNKFTFTGQFNTGNVAMSLSFGGDATLHGFHLLGNPFSSGLNWDDIINSIYFTYPSNTSKSLYFTRDNVQCSYVGGIGIPSDVNGIIPPMQGFFIKTYSTGNTITLPAAARVQGNIHARYKGTTIIPLIRLSLTEDTLSDETVVRFDEQAKTDLDNDFDAIKMFLASEYTSIYSSVSGINYAINGQPFPVESVEIPIVVNLTTNGNHTISATQLQGLDNYNVTLTDKSNSFTVDLKTTPNLTFTASVGTLTDRFVLKVSKIATGIEDPLTTENKFNIYQTNSLINIQTVSDEWNGKTGTVKVLDLTGKTVANLRDAEFWKNSVIQVPAIGLKGIYIVEVKSGVMRHVGKVVIK